jgi:hypothetical protein
VSVDIVPGKVSGLWSPARRLSWGLTLGTDVRLTQGYIFATFEGEEAAQAAMQALQGRVIEARTRKEPLLMSVHDSRCGILRRDGPSSSSTARWKSVPR